MPEVYLLRGASVHDVSEGSKRCLAGRKFTTHHSSLHHMYICMYTKAVPSDHVKIWRAVEPVTA